MIEGDEYTFGVSGKLIMNVLVMYDRQTKTLWSQLLGEAVEGELKGTKLEFLPAWQTTWADWKEKHPDTQALRKGYYGGRDPYDSYYASGRTGVIGQTVLDERLHVKEFVVGVEQNDEAVAYPFSVLNSLPVVNDFVGEVPILVVFSAETGTGVVFSRDVDGQTLTFQTQDELTLVDEETYTTWDGLTGEAIEGTLSGSALKRIKSTSSFWFGWKDWYPSTRVFGIDDVDPVP
ncbi:MAG: DUF3179 domain-containing protein [Anaerolineales bacterium]|nr:DUF3179 domain-containing protein [Chloroflexota bacterium]MBL6979809.1 DUF3179 domain-containing protein [Anaerolineales bacterium]